MTSSDSSPRAGATTEGLTERLEALGHGAWVMVVAILLGVATLIVALQEPPNRAAAAILQAITLVVTVYASVAIGTGRGERARQAVVNSHAASAWRRMRNLYSALGRQSDAVNAQADRLAALVHDGQIDFEQVRASLIALEYVVTEQIATADDALEDWRSLIPHEIERLENEARTRGQHDAE